MIKGDINAFRERFSRWKNGELVYDKGRPIELSEYGDGKDPNAFDEFRENHPTISTVASFLPVVGTAIDMYDAYKDPTAKNIGYAALSAATDILGGRLITKAVGQSIKRAKLVEKLTKEAKLEMQAWPYYKNMGKREVAHLIKYIAKRLAESTADKLGYEYAGFVDDVARMVVPASVYIPDALANISQQGFKNGKEDDVVTNYSIPFIKHKAIKLTNAGLATGARLSTNLLDSIADNAERAGLPLKTALGLAVKESTLGNPTDDRSMRTLLSPLNRYALRNAGYGQHINSGVSIDGNELINYYASDYNNEWGDPNPARGKSVLQKAFEFYKANPARYNPGQKNHPRLVEKRGDEVMKSPEIWQWLTERNYEKEREINSRMPHYISSWFTDYKNGKDSGIHIKPSHRGRLTALKKRTGKSEAELYRTGGPAVRKMITFARNARKWHHN